MPDRESVITHLQIIHTWAAFAREHDLNFFTAKHFEDVTAWTDDALALLKEQEAVVRCKDCIYFGNADKCIVQKYLHEHPEKIWFLSQQEDWFCADGKRKEGR